MIQNALCMELEAAELCGGEIAIVAAPQQVQLTPEAYQLWKVFQREVEGEMKDGAKFQSMRDWASKLPGGVLRIAGLFNYVVNGTDPIQQDTMDRAIRLGRILADHALAVFGLMERDPVVEDALKVLGWIRKQGKREFTVRDCFCAHQSRFKRVDKLQPAVNLLDEHWYVKGIPRNGVINGRPSDKYVVNPKALNP
jgi:putative DNA primase/helicase